MLEETAEEKAYFESRGETEIPESKEVAVEEKPAEKPVEVKEDKEIPFVPEAGEKPGFVPKEALGEARRTNKELREELNAFREKAAKMEMAYQNMLQKLQPQEKPVNYSDDPDTYIQKFVADTNNTISALNGELNGIKENRQLEAQQNEFRDNILTKEKEFLARNPDYNDAVEHWRKARLAQLEPIISDPQERIKTLNQEAIWIGSNALKNNINPAEAVYKMAQAVGWKSESKPDVANKIQTIKNGQERSTNVTGEAPVGAPNSLEELAKLPPEEFDKHFDRIMGKKSGSGLFN